VNRRVSQSADDPCCLRSTEVSSTTGATASRGQICVHFRYGPMTCSPSWKMALSIGFGNSISLLPAIQATRLLTFASVGLPPTEHTCFFLVALPYGEFSPVQFQGRYVRRGLPNRHAHIVASLGLLPSFVLSAFIVVILGLSRGTSRAWAPPFERPSPLYPRGPRSGPAFALQAIIA